MSGKPITFASLKKRWRENQSKYMVGVNCAAELESLEQQVRACLERRRGEEEAMSELCDESSCPVCGAQCDRKQDHKGQHHCINCGCRWTNEDEEEAMSERAPITEKHRKLADKIAAADTYNGAKLLADALAEHSLIVCTKLWAVAKHLNLSNPPQPTDILTAVALVEQAAEWARHHIEERGKQNDELRKTLAEEAERVRRELIDALENLPTVEHWVGDGISADYVSLDKVLSILAARQGAGK